MLDFMWAISNQLACEWARWAPEDKANYKDIKVELIENPRVTQTQPIQNLWVDAERTTLSTRFRNNYAPGQFIYFRGVWWTIITVNSDETAVNPQTAALLGRGVFSEYYLELLKIDDCPRN